MSLAFSAPSPAHGVDAVSPPREREVRVSDLTKSVVPLPFMLTVIGSVVAIAFFVASIKSDMRLMEAAMSHERQLRTAQFEELKARIDAAGMRNANLSFSNEIQKLQQENARLLEQLKQR